MKKNMLRIMATVTIMGGLFVSTNVTNVKAEEYPEMIVFDDVPVNHWAYDDIMDVVYNKVMLGYGNGKFGVGDNVTREQVAAVLYRTLNLKKEGPLKNPYKDISERATMFLDEILVLTKHGIFEGDEKGNFRPAAPVTRAEMAQILTKAFTFEVKKNHTFKDVPNNHWAKNAISALQSNHVIVGTGNGEFEPNKVVTREQYATFLNKAVFYFPVKDENYE
ncbi:S-layer family protein [Bacillus thuringiensis]|uniref:S-layer family protein n=1 Tax=Bacillus thuringiensis TaxID=1428 RepID=A0A4R4BEU3_BACTU|nr:S-layer homology domain-containing protein [Bacillus thuringiensis]TCW53261.1 S-layer family protein [Bacillus thuringiensis]TCW53442.1 S-layer family protein [Bacillus thuringiensis]